MIQCSQLTKTFQVAGLVKAGLMDVNLSMEEGDFIVIIGANGSGKSTFLSLLSGALLPSSGKIVFDGNDVTQFPAEKRAPFVSTIFQNPAFGTAGKLTLLENLRLASLRTGKKRLAIGTGNTFKIKMQDALSKLGFGLENRLDAYVETLSGGQRQALSLLMAIQNSTRLLLLDEPTSALDPPAAQRLSELITQVHLTGKITIVLVSHNMKESSKFGNRLLQLEGGRLVRDVRKSAGTPSSDELYRFLALPETSS